MVRVGLVRQVAQPEETRDWRWSRRTEDVWGMAQLWKKIDGLGDAFGGRGRYVDAVAAIVLRGCANVPAVDAVTDPGAADRRVLMEKDLSAGWCKGRAIEIIDTVEMG